MTVKKWYCLLAVAVACITAGCSKENAAPAAAPDASFVQDFDSLQGMFKQGWLVQNNSFPKGTNTWRRGVYGYNAFTGLTTGYPGFNNSSTGADYVLCDFSVQANPVNRNVATGNIGRASCWLISPAVNMKNGDEIIFYTRTLRSPALYPDRLQLRLNYSNGSAQVGSDSASVGDFTTLALTINPNMATVGYPAQWTRYSYTVAGSNVPKPGRFAFRYYTPDAGSAGANGQGIGIDAVEFVSKRR